MECVWMWPQKHSSALDEAHGSGGSVCPDQPNGAEVNHVNILELKADNVLKLNITWNSLIKFDFPAYEEHSVCVDSFVSSKAQEEVTDKSKNENSKTTVDVWPWWHLSDLFPYQTLQNTYWSFNLSIQTRWSAMYQEACASALHWF